MAKEHSVKTRQYMGIRWWLPRSLMQVVWTERQSIRSDLQGEGHDVQGLILSIDRCAMHDGPGIRTLVRLKGCPLRCVWCSTPQSQTYVPEVMILETSCNGCGRCVSACPRGAVGLSEGSVPVIMRSACMNCGKCVESCPYGALRLVGTLMTAYELFCEIEKESIGYRASNGGVTIGGGEPVMQNKFVTEVLALCRRSFINTAIETCGYTKWAIFEQMLAYVDLLYFDLKHMNNVAHKAATRVPNGVILHNARRAAQICPTVFRIPIIPSINDDDENIKAAGRFIKEIGGSVLRVELLPYHAYGVPNYRRIGLDYQLPGLIPSTESRLEKLRQIIESYGLEVRIGSE